VFGTIPVGRDAMPNVVGILIGAVASFTFVCFVGAPILSPTGRHDLMTELVLKCHSNPHLLELREETRKCVEGSRVAGDETNDSAMEVSEAEEEPKAAKTDKSAVFEGVASA